MEVGQKTEFFERLWRYFTVPDERKKKIEEAREGCKLKLYLVFFQFDGG